MGFFQDVRSSPLTILSFEIPLILLLTLIAYLAFGNRTAFSWSAVKNSAVSLLFLASNFLLIPVIYISTTFMASFYAALGVPTVPAWIWESVPFWATVIVAIIGYDFANYSVHRLMHTAPVWPVHAIHHSDSHVNGFTSFRIHAVESVMMAGTYILFLNWLSLPAEALALGSLFIGVHNIYVHMEADIEHGPFKWIIASPRFHRWHHADVPEAYGKNLANVIPAFDVLFGTYYNPGPCDEIMGAEKAGVPDLDFAKLFLLPFAAAIGGALKVLRDNPLTRFVTRRSQPS
ncbi:MAG: sterol desaturase family protein [Alphaproteobacteria bacterium]